LFFTIKRSTFEVLPSLTTPNLYVMSKKSALGYFLFYILVINFSYSQVGIGTTTPTPGSVLDITSTDKGLLVPRVNITNLSTIAPITGGTPTGLLVWNTNAGTGIGFHCWDGSAWAQVGSSTPNVDNGLNYNSGADRIRLGGALIEDTTIPQGGNDMTYNLDGSGDFIIEDNGTAKFHVYDDGRIEMPGTDDATGVGNTGVLEIGNTLRFDSNEIITSTGVILYINNDNNSDVRFDGNTLAVDATNNRVGVGTTTPDYDLDVEGNIGHDQYMYHNGDNNTYWRFTNNDQIRIQAGGRRMLDFIEGTNDYAVFNEGGQDIDFRVESDNQVNQFFIDGADDRIGIRTNAPTSFFEMTNGGVDVGANAMAEFNNSGADGVALSSYNISAANPYNGFEGITNYGGNAFVASGVFGLAINGSVTHTAIGVRGVANGRDGIGVYGTRQNAGGPVGWGGVFYNDLGYTGFFGAVSDRKTKQDVKAINKAMDIVNKLKPVVYKFDQNKYPNMGLNTEKEYGFIAQEVRAILPEITRRKKLHTNATKEVKANDLAMANETETFTMIDYTKLIPILTQAIKEQQDVISTQESRIKALETKMEKILK